MATVKSYQSLPLTSIDYTECLNGLQTSTQLPSTCKHLISPLRPHIHCMSSQRKTKNLQQVHLKVLNITNHQGKASQNYNEMSLQFSNIGFYWSTSIVAEDVEKGCPCTHQLLVGKQNSKAIVETWRFLSLSHTQTTIWLAILFLGV